MYITRIHTHNLIAMLGLKVSYQKITIVLQYLQWFFTRSSYKYASQEASKLPMLAAANVPYSTSARIETDRLCIPPKEVYPCIESSCRRSWSISSFGPRNNEPIAVLWCLHEGSKWHRHARQVDCRWRLGSSHLKARLIFQKIVMIFIWIGQSWTSVNFRTTDMRLQKIK
jgi:hypothetical protein